MNSNATAHDYSAAVRLASVAAAAMCTLLGACTGTLPATSDAAVDSPLAADSAADSASPDSASDVVPMDTAMDQGTDVPTADASDAPDVVVVADGAAAVICAMPGNAGTTGQTCNFLLTPNVIYASPSDDNNNLPDVTTPINTAPRGDADPCIRRDPGSGTIFMTYTYAGGGALDTDMASSTDGGAHWTWDPAATAVWPGTVGVADPYTGGTTTGTGVVNSETSNFSFRSVASGEIVYGIHSVYWQAAGATDDHTARLVLTESTITGTATPTALHTALRGATEGTAGVVAIKQHPETACPGSACAGVMGTTLVDLWSAPGASGATDDVSDCVWFHEPSVRWQESDQTLYLLVQCESASNQRIAVFGTTDAATETTPNPSIWSWTYEGSFLPSTAAVDTAVAYGVPSAGVYFTQGELATALDGSLVYLASLVHLDGGAEAREGLAIVGLASLSPPTLTSPTTRTPGASPYRAFIELNLAINGGDGGRGPGSATYDPALTATGVVYGGRTYPHPADGFETDLFCFPSVAP